MGNCLKSCGGCCYGCLCCEFNFAIFPSPTPSYAMSDRQNLISTFTNSNNQKVPYLQLRQQKARFNIIYFHGNAEDIGYSSSFLIPIQQQTKANVYALQYPCYGTYQRSFGARISDDIKTNSLQFYDHLSKINGLNIYNTVIIGRSIGTGGASYLAKRRDIQNLVLISPFSTIPSVAQDFVGCIGCIVKTHFNNEEQIRGYKGKLLVIHGKVDEVIAYKHGVSIVSIFEEGGKKCVMISPPQMSHNYFSMEYDIVKPIKQFTKTI